MQNGAGGGPEGIGVGAPLVGGLERYPPRWRFGDDPPWLGVWRRPPPLVGGLETSPPPWLGVWRCTPPWLEVWRRQGMLLTSMAGDIWIQSAKIWGHWGALLPFMRGDPGPNTPHVPRFGDVRGRR